MTLWRRLVVASAVVTLVSVLLGVAVGAALRRSNDAVAAVAMRWGPANNAAQRLLTHLVDQETGERGYLYQGDSAFLDPYRKGVAAANTDIARLRTLAAGDVVVQTAVNRVQSAMVTWQTRSAAPDIAARRAHAGAVGSRLDLTRGKQLFDTLRSRVASLQSLIEKRREAAQERVHDVNSALAAWLWATAAVALIIGLGTMLALRGWVLRPMHRLSRALRRVAAGDHESHVAVTGPPDFVAVADDAEAMRRRIVDELERSEAARQALEQRGPVVLSLSQQLSPRATDPVPGLRYAAALRPAEGLLAGDWVDVLPLGRDRVALMLLDVSGHGAAAGLEAMRLKHVLTTALLFGHAPNAAMERAAAGFSEDERFATAAIVVVDVVTGELRWCNAGHLPPCVVPLDAERIDPEELVRLEPTGPLLSSSTSGWRMRTGRLDVGQMLLAFSDGLIEARDLQGREFGIDGMCAALSQTTVRDVDTAVSVCLAAVRAHADNPHRDDITVLAASRDPSTVVATDDASVRWQQPTQAVLPDVPRQPFE